MHPTDEQEEKQQINADGSFHRSGDWQPPVTQTRRPTQGNKGFILLFFIGGFFLLLALFIMSMLD